MPGARAVLSPEAARQLARLAATLALCTAAGALAQALHSPLPWMIGPLLATALATLLGAPTQGAQVLRNAGLWVLGTVLGLYFTPTVVAVLWPLAPAIALGLLWALALGYGGYRWLLYSHRGRGLLPATAYFAGAIGGASEMALLADRHKAQVDRVAAAHALRVVIVVVAIPFALQAGGVHGADVATRVSQAVNPAGLARLLLATSLGVGLLWWWRLPNPWVLGALVVSALVSAQGIAWSGVPRPLSNAAQLVIGLSLGVRFSPAFVRTAPRWLGAVALGTVGMIALSAGFAALLAWMIGLHPATLLLATSPGGIAELAITASVLGLGVPVVTAFHVARYVTVLLLTEPVWRWEKRRLARQAQVAD